MIKSQIGIVAFSFSLREESQEPSLCNKRLGDNTMRIVDELEKNKISYVVVAQWEVARHLRNMGLSDDEIVEVGLLDDGRFLDSKAVWDKARKLFYQMNITTVIPVAHPFIHLGYILRMIKKDNFYVIKKPIKKIGFDNHKENLQSWTRSPLAIFLYAVKIKLGFSHGHKGRQNPS